VARDVTVVLHVTRVGAGETAANADAGLRITAEFPVALADHDISRPRFLFAKLGEVQKVYVDLSASADAPSGAPSPE
jgi:hypothetical protein